MSSGANGIPITDFSPDKDHGIPLGNDGTNGKPKKRWSDVVADGLNDGEGNKITMTEAVQLLLELKAAKGG